MCEVMYHICAKKQTNKKPWYVQGACSNGSQNLTTSHSEVSQKRHQGVLRLLALTFLQVRGKKSVFTTAITSTLSLKIVLSDLCINNRLHASISDLCFSFEISPISDLPVLTHWAECLVSQK